MPDDFVIARNPDGDSSLPYLLRVPLVPNGVILKSRATWPRTSKVYCHRIDEWPADVEIVERVPTGVRRVRPRPRAGTPHRGVPEGPRRLIRRRAPRTRPCRARRGGAS